MDTNEITAKPEDKQQEEGENDWFFDIIINFLRSPRWKTPVMSFLDEYCIVFDNEDENKLEYTKIHNDFKKLVEELIGCLLAELGVTQEQFMEACEKAGQNPIHKRIVDQIVAVDNFQAFKKLMQKRNHELNQQAMKLMMKKQAQEGKEKQAAEPKGPTPEEAAELKRKNTEQMLAEQEKTLKQEGGVKDKEMMEAIRIAQEAEKAEEEELMRRAIEASEQLDQEAKKKEDDEEAELIRQAIEASAKEEEARKQMEAAAAKAEEQPKSEPEPVVEAKAEAMVEAKPIEAEPPVEVKQAAPLEKKLEEEKQEETVPAPTIPPEKLIEITGKPAMSQAELKKLEELKRLKKEAKQSKQKEAAEQAERRESIQMKADSLPPVAFKRKGQFELIPDFLKKETQKDMANVYELDTMADAFAKQDAANADSGLSMSELFKQKTMETEKLIGEKGAAKTGPDASDVQDRKQRLLAQRDKLRKIQEEKRQQELQEFQSKTETKSTLFAELKKMDDDMKQSINKVKSDVDNERRLEMFRKAREDVKKENFEENEAAYQKRSTQLSQKDAKAEVVQEDWLGGMKAHNVDDN